MSAVVTPFDPAELAGINARFETSSPRAIITWAVERFGSGLCIAASMQDAVLIDIATKVDPAIEVVFIDTGLHFPETLATVERVRVRYDLNLHVERVPTPAVPFPVADPEKCCAEAKVTALNAALAGKAAWMSGLRRTEATTRADTPIALVDRRGLLKLNPLATWSDLDVAGYIADHEVPTNPLLEQGYPSIGCAPCTSPVAPDADPRSGRWAGLDKTECGIHE